MKLPSSGVWNGEFSGLWIVRHGESENNVLKIECTDLRNQHLYGLTPFGIEQTKTEASRYDGFSAILTSPLRRSRETAEIFASVSGCPVVVEELLIECSVGIFEMRTESECQAWKMEQGANFSRYPDGESREDVRARAAEVLARVRSEFGDSPVLLVSHGMFIRAFFENLSPGYDLAAWQAYLASHNQGRNVFQVTRSFDSLFVSEVASGRLISPRQQSPLL